MRCAALDLGSNTFLLLICEFGVGGMKVLSDETRVVRLGQGVNATKRLHLDALVRAEECFRDFSKKIKDFSVDHVRAVATSAARDAENGHELLSLGTKYGIPIEIVPGQAEAEMTYSGATFDLSKEAPLTVIDVGGGSTEIMGKSDSGKIQGCSVDVGSVRLSELFISEQPVSSDELAKLKEYAVQQFVRNRDALEFVSGSQVVAVAGTPTTLACLEIAADFDESRIHRSKLSLERLLYWQSQFASLSVDQIKDLPGMPPKRADLILAGTTILIAACEVLSVQEILVSTKGVRFGLALSMEKAL